ncbi:hypothetical protein [Pseudonocardia acaciae]|uniref:hypothetical protein n=1 Tax=Pseudonocardia acaciae TaxID=551276 RepID=UPI0012EDC862|nr:hypothetical protein [Pseudonocardia acaciae]
MWAALACVAVVLVAVAWVAGKESVGTGDGTPARSWDAERLGPEQGQPVAAYLAGLPARLPAQQAAAVPALVQLGEQRDIDGAVRLVAGSGAEPVTAVLRVPLPRVQTALRFERLPPVDAADAVAGERRRFELAWGTAARAAAESAGRQEGRPGAVARYEAAALGERPPCACLLAVLVVGDRAALTELAARPGVRAVDAAPVGTPATGVALAPLLPEQADVAGPVPDDGPVPEAPGGAGR